MTRIVIHPGRMRQVAAGLYSLRKALLATASQLEAAGPPSGAPWYTRQYAHQRDDLLVRLRKQAEALVPEAQALRRRTGLVEESALLHGPNITLTQAQRDWLWPRGQKAIDLKLKLQILAKLLGITPPKGFDPSAPLVGRPAQELLRMINLALGGPAVGGFNSSIRRRLRSIQLPTQWEKLAQYPGNGAGDQRLACWLAANAKQRGIPPLLPVMCAIPESGLTNHSGGDRDSVGFFQIRAGLHPVPPGFGADSGRIRPESWWHEHPEAQWAWFSRTAAAAARGSAARTPNTTDPDQLARWSIDIERSDARYEYRYREAYQRAKALVDRCQQLQASAAAGAGAGARPDVGGGTYLYPRGNAAVMLKHKLEILARRLNVPIPKGFDPDSAAVDVSARALLRAVQKRLGTNVSGGFDVHVRRELEDIAWVPPGSPYAERLLHVAGRELRQDHEWKYQSLTGTPNQAWCASFVSWALKKAGDPTPFVSASVGAWVDAARDGRHGLKIITAADARPGDLVAYDWNGGGDFYGKSHIGIVSGGDAPKFQTIHGNWGGQMAHSTLTTSGGSGTVDGTRGQVVFIRVEK